MLACFVPHLNANRLVCAVEKSLSWGLKPALIIQKLELFQVHIVRNIS